MPYSRSEIVELWRNRVVKRANVIDPDDIHDWWSIWAGFVIALGRADLIHEYEELGFPVECEAWP